MRQVVLARRYAKALFQLAEEKRILDAIAGELASFQTLMKEDANLQHFLLSPDVSRQQKTKFIEQTFQDDFSALFINFMLVLLRKGRQNILDDIASEFSRLHDKHSNRVRARVVTAIPLSEKDLQDVGKSLSARYQATFEIENHINPEVLGGVILQIDGRVLDGSLRMQLQKLRARLIFELN